MCDLMLGPGPTAWPLERVRRFSPLSQQTTEEVLLSCLTELKKEQDREGSDITIK